MRCAVLVLAALLAASSPAAAQTYVSASLVGDIARFSHVDLPGFDDRSGEAVGFGLRVGTPIGAAWGVELEFVRPSLISSSAEAEVIPAYPQDPIYSIPGLPLFPEIFFPPIRYEVHTETRNTTVAASVWAKQELTGRFSLVYSGGMAMVRSHQSTGFDYVPGVGVIGVPRIPGSFGGVQEAVNYSVRPVAGVEARIGMTEHLQLMPGVRLFGLESGWLLRPAVGLGWTF
jgi:hypothetical protein